jgi:methionyl-tRNA formyltransferase
LNIVFIGTVTFSYKSLQKLLSLNANIVGVCTKTNSAYNSDFEDLSPLCEMSNIPYHFFEDINSQITIRWIEKKQPDIIFCFGLSNLIKKELLQLAPMGVLGFHPTKLPQNRGRHPIIWSLALGLNETASSFFFMNEGADDGDILSQEVVTIEYHDNAKTLYQKIIDTALKQIEIFLPLLQNNTFTTIPQDNIKSNIWRKRSIKDGMIDFRMSSKSIYNLVRALTKPYVGAHIIYQNTNIPIWEVEEVVYNNANIEPGKILSINQETILVKTSDGAIRLLEHQFTNLPEIGDYL